MGENYSVLEKLNHLMISKACNLTADQMDHIDSFYHRLRFLAIILKDMDEKRQEDESTMKLKPPMQIDHVIARQDNSYVLLTLKFQAKGQRNNDKSIQLLQDFNDGVHSSMSMENRTMVDEEIAVGFDDEALTIKELLAGGKKQLQMISIVGMPGLGIEWGEISVLGMMLTNLEFLKLDNDAAWGQQWATTDGGFPRLKFLKLKELFVKRWITCSGHFPSLQLLSLEWCPHLKEIPSSLGDILTLQMIEVNCCQFTVVESVRKIKEEHESNGNNWLKVLIREQPWTYASV
ncbi:hypothetical protein LOK49_LG02G02913 [Camellia lanceoleosa]|uniref:Uncharacterized protein n=1 Tax=Camellia lanceoleosa TaxID=1840588 RepID=A0ACC0IMK6_9ERIC|nr:hypothetical protein LOK49_LG02G02913 [Camellia lanceoleosa]